VATISVTSEVTASVWKIEKKAGDPVAQDEIIMILESMKMEIPVMAPEAGTLSAVLVSEGESVEEEQELCKVET